MKSNAKNMDELIDDQRNLEMMQKWFVVQNGKQIDIHVRVPSEDRELTLVADVRNERVARLMASAPELLRACEAAERAIGSTIFDKKSSALLFNEALDAHKTLLSAIEAARRTIV